MDDRSTAAAPNSAARSGSIGDFVRLGGDLRYLRSGTEVPDEPAQRGWDLEEFRLYGHVSVLPGRLAIHVDQRMAPGSLRYVGLGNEGTLRECLKGPEGFEWLVVMSVLAQEYGEAQRPGSTRTSAALAPVHRGVRSKFHRSANRYARLKQQLHVLFAHHVPA